MSKLRITAKPYREDGRAFKGQPRWIIPTNEGNYYLSELVERLGNVGLQLLQRRLRRMPWDHPDILAPKARKGHRLGGEPTFQGIPRSEHFSEEMQKLGIKPRSENLSKIPPMGSWEERYYGREERDY